MEQKHEILTIRVETKLDNQLQQIAKEQARPRSEIVRRAITEYIKKETELEEIKRFVAKKFAEGKLSFEDMVKFLGYKEAQKVAFYYEIAKKSFETGLQ